MRRFLPLAILIALPVAALSWLGGEAKAQGERGRTVVDLVKVEGVIDPSVASYVRDTVAAAQRSSALVILQIDSPGTFGDEALELAHDLRSAEGPVVAWVGPAGSRAQGGALFVVYSSSLVAMAPGAGIGPGKPFDLAVTATRESRVDVASGSRELLLLARRAGVRPAAVRRLLEPTPLAARPALSAGAVSLLASQVLGEGQASLLRRLDGRSLPTARGPVRLETVNAKGELDVELRFHQLGLWRRILHAVSTPTAVYVLLLFGLWALAFELTQPGVGAAGVAAILSLALGAYALTVVPVRWSGLALILVGTGLMALDVVIRRVGLLTLAGAAAFAGGSLLAWGGVAPAIDLPVWLVVVATAGAVLFFGFALTVALKARERIKTSQVGLVGLLGEARADLDPEGAVFVKGNLWRARSMNGPIAKGRRVRIRGMDGLILRVEEEESE